MPVGSGGLLSQESSVAQSCLRPRGSTVLFFTATPSGLERRSKSAITASSGTGEWRRGGPIGYGWCASASKWTGEPEHLIFFSAVRPLRQNTSRQNSTGAIRWPPGGSPNGEVPAVITMLLGEEAFTPA